MSRFERVGDEVAWEGRILSVHEERFRHEDGEEVEREILRHPGAVGIVAHDDETLWLVRQPREAVGDPALLEIPAGKLDEEGESPLQTAKRELAEEIGKRAEQWDHLVTYWSSAGFTDEQVHVYLATGLSDESAESGENERIDVVRWPLDQLAGAIEQCVDAKSLIGLLVLERRMRS